MNCGPEQLHWIMVFGAQLRRSMGQIG